MAALEGLPLWAIGAAPTIEIGAREGEPGHDLFGVQSAFVLEGGRLVIANGGSTELRYYSAVGEYLASSGGEGGGPGEFVAIQRADPLPGDSVLVFDSRERRFSLFDHDGAFVSDGRFPPGEVRVFSISTGALADGRSVTLSGAFGDMSVSGLARDSSVAILHERSGAIIDTLAWQPGTEMLQVLGDGLAIVTMRPFYRQEFVRAGGSTIALATNDEFSFELRDGAGSPHTLVRVDATGCPTTDAEFDAWVAAEFEAERDDLASLGRDIAAAAPRHDTHPPFQVLFVDRLGHVWVGRRTCDGEAVDYSVFSPDGSPVGRLSLAAGQDLMDSGADYIVVRSRDELDREIVRVFPLDRSPD